MRMPSLFMGHGSPRTCLQDTPDSDAWKALAARFPRPSAIVCISAHWETKGVLITGNPVQRTIHDFYRMSPEMYEVRYEPPGDPDLAFRIEAMLDDYRARADLDSWGLDHGAWAVLRFMYPDADIPTIQISMDIRRTPEEHYAIGRVLAPLRGEGVLIMGSGNVVHNLRVDRPRDNTPFPWAQRFDDLVHVTVLARDDAALIDYTALPDAEMAVPESEHYLPLLYALGARERGEAITVLNRTVLASVSMTCYAFGVPEPTDRG